MRRLIFTLSLSLWATLGFAAPQANIEVLPFGWSFWELELLRDATQPRAANAQWQTLRLPDSGRAAKTTNNQIWYRIQLPDELPDHFRSGVFIDRSLMNLEVYLNDDYLGSGGRTSPRVDRNWNQPHLFRIPASSWQASNNMLYIHLIGSSGFSTLSPPILVDYDQAYNNMYHSKQLIRIELSRLSFAVVLCIALFCWLIWLQTRQRLLLILGVASMAWLVVLAYAYFRQFPLTHTVFLRLTHWCIDACSLLLLLFAHTKYGYRTRKLSLSISAYLISLAIALALAPNSHIVLIANSLHLISQAVIVYLVALTGYKYWRQRSASDLSFCIGLVVIIGFQIHDVSLSLSSNWDRWMHDAHLGHLSVPVLFVLLCFSLSNMYKHHVRTAAQLNRDLEQRLTTAKADLQQQLAASEQLATQQRVSEERERVYRDVHDDLGAKLLTLVYASPDRYKNDLARSALADLRDVVSRTTANDIELSALLTDTLEEQQQRCNKLGVHLSTSIHGDCSHTRYNSRKAVLFKRLLRELVGVFIHSAQAQALRIDIMVAISGVEATVVGDASAAHIDSLSLKARAARIHSELHVLQEADEHLQVVFWIPNTLTEASPIEGV